VAAEEKGDNHRVEGSKEAGIPLQCSERRVVCLMDASRNDEIVMTAPLRAAAVVLLVCLMVLHSVRAQSAGPFTPRDIRAAYDVDPLLNSGYTGKGVTVAIVNTGIDSTFRSHSWRQPYASTCACRGFVRHELLRSERVWGR